MIVVLTRFFLRSQKRAEKLQDDITEDLRNQVGYWQNQAGSLLG